VSLNRVSVLGTREEPPAAFLGVVLVAAALET